MTAGQVPSPDTGAPDDGMLERAEALLQIDRNEQAAELFARVVAADPGSAQAWTGLSRCRSRLEDLPGALAAADEALRADPAYAHAMLMRGAVLSGLGRHPEAVAAAQEGVRLAPEAYEAHLSLARTLSMAPGGMRGAYEVAHNAVRLAPEEAPAHFLLGAIAHELKLREVAEQAYTNALRLDPGHTDARNNLSVLHLQRGFGRRRRFSPALEGFADVAAADLKGRTARYNLEAMVFGVVARARWLGLLSLFIGLMGALASGAGQGSPPMPGDLVPRLVTIALLALVWALWVLRVRKRVPRRLHGPLFALARACRPIVVMAVAVCLPALVSVSLVAVPWSDSAFLGATITPSVWLTVIAYWLCRSAVNRRKPAG